MLYCIIGYCSDFRSFPPCLLLQVEALKARSDVVVVSVSRDNRDQLVHSISSQLRQALQQLPSIGCWDGR
jgi:hypothetical protein